jgi:carboxymethylenebutenolidase
LGYWVEDEKDEVGPRSFYAQSGTGRGPGVLVLHAWWGLNDFFTGLCDRLADQGFCACAPDLYDGRIADTIPQAEALMQNSDRQKAFEHIDAALRLLPTYPGVTPAPIGVIGFSLGAAWGLYFSTLRPQQIAAVVHCYGTETADYRRAQAAYQGHYAVVDEWEPIEGVQGLHESLALAGREAAIFTYPGTGHWFMESNRPADYRPEAAELAWSRIIPFLHEKLDG